MTMLAPALARPSAIALPIPLLPPVTIATLSFNVIALAPSPEQNNRRERFVAVSLSRRVAVSPMDVPSIASGAKQECVADHFTRGRGGAGAVDDPSHVSSACRTTRRQLVDESAGVRLCAL